VVRPRLAGKERLDNSAFEQMPAGRGRTTAAQIPSTRFSNVGLTTLKGLL
jgi:hypothetical protein